MIRLCAWCKRLLGFKEPLTDPRTTHGICEACLKHWGKVKGDKVCNS